jgi:spore coat polysaccharide biosynthesis protein SpsF
MKIGALVPVRLASERMPGKALLPIAGRPAILHLVDRLCGSKYLTPRQVVFCTTEDASDDPLVATAQASGAQVYRGSRDNIIDRLYKAVQQFDFDLVIQADGDDPCSDTTYMDLCMDRLLADPCLDIVVTDGLPLGLGSKAIRASAIQTVWQHHVTNRNDTGFIYYFTRTGLCKTASVKPVCPAHVHRKARLTLDYPEDLAFFEALFKELYKKNSVFGIDSIVALLQRRPDLVAINAGLNKKYRNRTRQLAQLDYQVDGKIIKIRV